jgi:geranylgeranyl pyrophosphate synthase
MTRSTNRMRLRTAALIAVLALCGAAMAACGSSQDDDTKETISSETTASHNHEAQADLQAAMRTLWVQHMEWTWSTVTAFAADAPSLQANLDRLLRNQQEIGNAIESYYGEAAAKQLTDLLTVHINQAVPVLNAAKTGDKPGLDKALADWYANAQDVADFLSKANPENWPQATVRDAMKGHIDMTVAYASDVIGGKYVEAVKDYDEAEAHMIHLADTLTQGVIAQFPDKF